MTDQENFGNEFALLIRNKLPEGYLLSQLDLAYIRLVGRTVYQLMDQDKKTEADKDPIEFIVPAVRDLASKKILQNCDPYELFIDADILNTDLTIKKQ